MSTAVTKVDLETIRSAKLKISPVIFTEEFYDSFCVVFHCGAKLKFIHLTVNKQLQFLI